MSKQRTVKPYESDEYFQKWLTGLADRTKKNYTEEYNMWHEFIGMTPTEQIEKRLKDTASMDMTERMFFENKFREFKENLEKKGELRPSSVKTYLKSVASFFSRNGLPLNLKRGDWQTTQTQEIIKRFKLSKEDVKAMYVHGNLRDRSLLLVLAQSGFSEADVSEMKIENLKGIMENPETEHYFLEKGREKTGEIQATCFSYEAVHDIKAMLQERGNPTEGYLFVSTTKGLGDKLEVRSINDAMKTLAEKTFGAEKAKEFKTKSLRSFYNSALLRSGIKQEIKDLLMGHSRAGARKAYDYDEYTIKEAYQKAFEYLSINGIQTRQDIKQLKEDMNEIIGAQQVEISELKQKIENTDATAKETAEQLKIVVQELREISEKMGKLSDEEKYKDYKKQQSKKV